MNWLILCWFRLFLSSMKFIHKIVIWYFFGLGFILSVLSSIIMLTLIKEAKFIRTQYLVGHSTIA